MAKEVERVLLKAGFKLTHGRRSHQIYRKEDRIVTVAFHGKQTIPVGTLLSILKQAGIDREEI